MPRMSTAVPSLIQECEGVEVNSGYRYSSSTVSPPSNVCTVSSTSTSRRQCLSTDERSIKQRSKIIYENDKKRIEEETVGRRKIERRIESTMGKLKRTRREAVRRDESLRIIRGEIAKDVEEGMEEDGGIYEMVEEVNPRISHSSLRTSRLSESDFGPTRKNNKPQMEKKRRQREKQSLNQLREYVLTAYKVDPSRYMDKAEILEKTVKFMQHIMKKYYPVDEKDSNGEFRLADSPTCRNETGQTKTQSEIRNGKFNLVNNNKRFESGLPSMDERVVTLIIPQLGSNLAPQVIQQDNCNNYWSVGQTLNGNKVVSDNSSEKSTTLTSPSMKFVVNHNYYMNSVEQVPRVEVPAASDKSYVREVLSPDTTTGNLMQYKFQEGSASPTINPVSIISYPDFISIAQSQRRIAPKLDGNHQFGNNLSLVTQQRTTGNTFHRPWEK